MPDSGLDLHAPLVKVFPPQVTLDPNKQHQEQGAFANNNPQEAIQLHRMDRLQQEYAKDQPWDPSQHGTLGKIGHVFSQIGNGIANTLVPGEIPGSSSYRHATERNLAKEINDQIGEESQNQERNALAAKTQEDTAEEPGKTQSEEELQRAQTANLNSENEARLLLVGHAHAVQSALRNNLDPHTDPTVLAYEQALQAQQKQPAAKGAHFIQREVGGKPHTVAVDDMTGEDIRDEGETGEKPPVFNVNAANSEMDREATRLGKPYEKGASDAQAQLDKIADARAMVNGNAESQALGMPKVLTALVSGQGSGVRITQPELNSIAKARGLSGDIEGTLNKWSGKGQLTATQKQQLTQILDDVKTRIEKKAAIHSAALDSINGASSREQVIQADKLARQQLNEVQQFGFYTGEKLPQGTVVGFKNGKVQVDDAR
jgi:hypothetical protein